MSEGSNVYSSEMDCNSSGEVNEVLSGVSKDSVDYCGRLVNATVSAILEDSVIVFFGGKSDGIVPKSELKDISPLEVGSFFEVFIVKEEDKNGQIVVSRRKAKYVRSWMNICDSEKNGTILRGNVVSKIDGGVMVDIGGIVCFLPGSHIDTKQIFDFDQYIGTDIDVIVKKINSYDSVILSHRAVIKKNIEQQKQILFENIAVGQVCEGVVENIVPYGAFVNLGGVSGLLHVVDISWDKISSVSEVLHVGQVVNVAILECDVEHKKISLGMKQLTTSPWSLIADKIHVGSVIRGKVTRIVEYGLFVEVSNGVEGLVHNSEISWSFYGITGNSFCKIGDEFDFKVVEFDVSNKRLSLSLKQLTMDPWSQSQNVDKCVVGEVCSGEVVDILSYGYIIRLDSGIEGVLFFSNCSWIKRVRDSSALDIKIGDKLDLKILEVSKSESKLFLGLKQMSDNPWVLYKNEFKIGTLHDGVVINISQSGCYIRTDHDFEGFLSKEYYPGGVRMEKGSNVQVKVLDFNRESERMLFASPDVDVKKVKVPLLKKGTKQRQSTGVKVGNLFDLKSLSEDANKK